MISEYQFGKIENLNCFDDGITNIIYFPVKDSPDFPKPIRDKAKKMIDSMIHTYELENNYKLDLSKLCLNARIIAFVGNSGNWSYEIAVVISGNVVIDDVWIEDSYSIGHKDSLYESFKAYIMKRLEEILFCE